MLSSASAIPPMKKLSTDEIVVSAAIPLLLDLDSVFFLLVTGSAHFEGYIVNLARLIFLVKCNLLVAHSTFTLEGQLQLHRLVKCLAFRFCFFQYVETPAVTDDWAPVHAACTISFYSTKAITPFSSLNQALPILENPSVYLRQGCQQLEFL